MKNRITFIFVGALLALAPLVLIADTARVPIAKTVTLTVESDGTLPIKHQWFRDGRLIPESVPLPDGVAALAEPWLIRVEGNKLIIPVFSLELGGLYHAVSSNEAGSVVSNKVQLTPVKQPSKSTITVNIAVGSVNP